jgi:hypothetical protein
MAIVIPAAKIAIKNQRSIGENPWQTLSGILLEAFA